MKANSISNIDNPTGMPYTQMPAFIADQNARIERLKLALKHARNVLEMGQKSADLACLGFEERKIVLAEINSVLKD